MKKSFLTLIILLAVLLNCFGQEYFKDITFGENGIVSTPIFESIASYAAVKLQSDGKILAVGSKYNSDDSYLLVVRYNEDGSIDETFGTNGFSNIDLGAADAYDASKVAVLNDGKIIISTLSEWGSCINVVKLNQDGTLDSDFGIEGIVKLYDTNIISKDLLIQPDGKIIVCGHTESVPEEFSLMRFNEDGNLDAGFGENGISMYNLSGNENPDFRSTLSSAFLHEDGRIFLGGSSSDYSSNPSVDPLSRCMTIACYNPDGTLSYSFGENGVLHFNLWAADWWQLDDLEILGDSSIIYVGHTGYYPQMDIIGKLNSSGIPDSSFNDVGYVGYDDGINNYGNIYSHIMMLENDDIIVMGESFTEDYMLLKYNSQGEVDNTFGLSGTIRFGAGNYSTRYSDFDIQTDNKIIVAGHVGDSIPALCRLVQKNNVFGTVFIDENHNQLFDTEEQGVAQHIVKIEPGPYYTTTVNEGYYYFSGNPGTYTITYLPQQYWALTTENETFEVSIENQQSVFENLNFGVFPKVNITDVSVSLTGSATRPYFETYYWLSYNSLGTNTQHGIIKMEYDSLLTFIETDYNPISHVDNIITWEYDTLTSMESRNIFLKFLVPDIEYLGDTLISFCSITPFDGDTLITNNYDTIRQIITGSYDPNDKQVTPQGIGSEGFVLHNSKLTYTIRFQNTGTDTAFNIVVVDTIDTDLDIETFRFVASSHPCTYEITGTPDDKISIAFKFTNVRLPQKAINEAGSNGFLKFSVNPDEGVSDFTQVSNIANIYFDHNPPIVTNETNNTFVSTLTNIQSCKQLYSIYPNPTNGIININSEKIKLVTVFSVDGKVVKAPANISQIDFSENLNGIYFIKIETSDGNFIAKVIKQ